MKQKIIINNKLDDINILSEKVEDLGEKLNLGMQTIFAVNLSLDEILTNIISYAYQDGKNHEIEISFEILSEDLTITIIDDGIAFDPLQNPPPETDLDLDEREIGGLGIHFVKEKMDQVDYHRSENKNILTLKKNIRS